ncbi:MAG TPA: Vms1/Ankzf1 family peptidyl-tRNA hydrolase, partial [Vicinamibacterales bacterium]|nr:Vms1/Ankzf1 family peptidyl-tRNA hydrolase [Vicinamibacterales bacterium]
MPKSTLALGTPLRAQLGRLAALEPYDAPFLSLYLDLHVDHEGRHTYDTFLRKAFGERQRTLTGAARKSFESDIERIDGYLNAHVRRSADGLAIFACAARDEFFEAVQLDVPHEHNWLFIASVPYLYPLARVNEQFPRYAALVVDTNAARLFVFALGAAEARREVNNVKTRKASGGGWAQARYERHLELFHLHHVKEVVDLLDRVVREEAIGRIVIACDATARPLLTDQLPQHLAERVVEMMRL